MLKLNVHLSGNSQKFINFLQNQMSIFKVDTFKHGSFVDAVLNLESYKGINLVFINERINWDTNFINCAQEVNEHYCNCVFIINQEKCKKEVRNCNDAALKYLSSYEVSESIILFLNQMFVDVHNTCDKEYSLKKVV